MGDVYTVTVPADDTSMVGAAVTARTRDPLDAAKYSFLIGRLNAIYGEKKGKWKKDDYVRHWRRMEGFWNYAVRDARINLAVDQTTSYIDMLGRLGESFLAMGIDTGKHFLGPAMDFTGLPQLSEQLINANRQSNLRSLASGRNLAKEVAELRANYADFSPGAIELNKAIVSILNPEIQLVRMNPAQLASDAAFPDTVRKAKKKPDGSIVITVEQTGIWAENAMKPVLDAASTTTANAVEAAKLAAQEQADLVAQLAGETPPLTPPTALKVERAIEAKHVLAAAEGALFGVAAIAKLIDPKLGADIERVGGAALQTADAAIALVEAISEFGEAADAVAALGTAAATGNVIGAVFTLVSIFIPVQEEPDPSRIIIDQVAAVRDDIAMLHGQMHERFDRIEEGLNTLYTSVLEELAPIQAGLAKVDLDIARVQDVLADQAVALQRIEDRLSRIARTQWRAELVDAIDDGIGYLERKKQPMPEPELIRVTNVFHNYAVRRAKAEEEINGARDRLLRDDTLARELNDTPLHENVTVLNDYLVGRGLGRLADGKLPNPFTWAMAASAYAQVLYDWPNVARAALKPEDARQIAEGGDDLAASFANIGPNKKLFAALHANYRSKIRTLATQLHSAAAAEYAAIKTGLGWPADAPAVDYYADSSQRIDVLPPALASMRSSTDGESVLDAPKDVLAWVPTVAVTHDWAQPEPSRKLALAYEAVWSAEKGEPRSDGTDVRGSLVLTVSATLGGVPLARKRARSSTVHRWRSRPGPIGKGSEVPDVGPPEVDDVLAVDWSSGFKALFEANSAPVPLTPAEQNAAADALAAARKATDERIRATRRHVHETLASRVAQRPESGDALAVSAVEVSGAKALLRSVIELGFSRAYLADDRLRAAFEGPPRALGGTPLPDQRDFVAALRDEALAPAASNEKAPLEAWAKGYAERVHKPVETVIEQWRDRVRDGTHEESVSLVENARRRLRIADLTVHGEDAVTRLGELKLGDKGADVRRVQGLIRAARPKLTDATLPINGNFGAKTAQEIKRIQKEMKLPETGAVDEPTWRALLGVLKRT